MFNTKTLLAAASVAILTAVGTVSASAAPWDRGDRHFNNHTRYERHGHIDRMRVHRALRPYRFTRVSQPFFRHGRFVVRAHDRFGRRVLVQIDPYTGRFIRRL